MLRTIRAPISRLARLALAASLLLSFVLVGGTPQTQAQAWPTVMLAPTSTGTIMTDANGWTLYTWDGDQEGVSNCFDACANTWPAFMVDTDLVAPDGLSGTLGYIDRGDGTWQVSLDNWPLYYFAGDASPGVANGDGSMGFGARWYITASVNPVAPVVAAPAPVAPQTYVPPVVAPPVAVVQPPIPVQARASVPVRIVDFNFGPPVNLQVGDTVIWTNSGSSAHTATADNGLFDSGRLNSGQTYSYTFNAPGTYPYHDAIGSTMRGMITVGATASGSQYNNGQYNDNNPYNNNSYAQGPFYGSPNDPGYGQGYNPGYNTGFDPYGNQSPYGSQNPYGGQMPYLGAPVGGYSATLNIVAPPNGIIALNWLAQPNLLSYRIYQTTAQAPLNFSVAQTINQTAGTLATGANLTGLTPGTMYLIQVRAVSFAGLETVTPAASIGFAGNGIYGLLAPTALAVSAINGSSLTLAWVGSNGAATYRVTQATSPAGPFTPSLVGGATSTGATVLGLNPTTTYYFQVTAVDAQLNQSPPSITSTWTTSTALAAPLSLNVSSITSNTVTSNWTPVASAVSYRVSQSQNINGPFALSSMMNLTSTGATVTGLLPATTYYFQVSALDGSGNASLASNTAMGLTTP